MRLPTKDSLIMLGIAVGMVSATYLAVYAPQGRSLDELSAQIVTKQASLDMEAQKVSVLPEMIRQVESLKIRYSDFDRRMPKGRELHEFLRQINSKLPSTELANLSIEPGNPSREDYFNTLPIIMKFRANYLSLAEFLSHLERMERLTRVQRLILQKDEKASDLTVELQLSIFFTEG